MRRHGPDHYRTLGVPQSATIGEIRQAFRKLAKQYHPDKNPVDAETARDTFESVTEAYRVLSDARQRELYDRDHKRRPDPTRRPTTPDDLCYHILDLLLDEYVNEAVQAFDALQAMVAVSIDQLDLPAYMDYPDARDCEFLLAEALERCDRTTQAIVLYTLALERESRRPHFRAFTEEIRSRVKRLHMRRLRMEIAEARYPTSADEALDTIFRIGVTQRERARWYKALGTALESAGEFDLARDAVRRAFEVYPSLVGMKRLCERLHLDESGAPVEQPSPYGDSTAQDAG